MARSLLVTLDIDFLHINGFLKAFVYLHWFPLVKCSFVLRSFFSIIISDFNALLSGAILVYLEQNQTLSTCCKNALLPLHFKSSDYIKIWMKNGVMLHCRSFKTMEDTVRKLPHPIVRCWHPGNCINESPHTSFENCIKKMSHFHFLQSLNDVENISWFLASKKASALNSILQSCSPIRHGFRIYTRFLRGEALG